MNQLTPIEHPIAVGKRIHANRPSCACRGAKLEPVEGTVGKVIQNHSGYWYYLTESAVTIKAAWVVNVF